MRMYRILNTIFLITQIVVYSSCSSNKIRYICEPDLLEDTVDTLNYSLFVDSIKYINLETTDNCLIGSVTDLVMTPERIFVFDKYRQTIWIFNQYGHFLNKIYEQGNGPGEYVRIEQFEFDKKSNQIIVLAWGSRLLFYSSDGEYVKDLKIPIIGSDFKMTSEGGFVISQAGLDDKSAGVYYVNAMGQEERILVKRKENHFVFINSDWELCSYDDVVCFMAPNFDNIVYHYKDSQLKEEYPFYMRPELKNEYRNTVSMQHFEDFIRTEYLESEKWIIARYWSSINDLRVFLYSKDSRQYWIGKSIQNDLDGKGQGTATSMSDNNIFVNWLENENPDENPIIQILFLK